MADSRLEDHPDAADAQPDDAPQQMVYRRAPKIAPFLVTGGVLGFVIACFWVPLQGASIEGYSQAQTLGFLGAVCAVVGVTIAALICLVLASRSNRIISTCLARRTVFSDTADVAIPV